VKNAAIAQGLLAGNECLQRNGRGTNRRWSIGGITPKTRNQMREVLDRAVIEEFLDDKFGDMELELPDDIEKKELVAAFCQYVEDDYYEWLRDNFKSFFDRGNPDWDWIEGRIEHYTRG